MSRLKVSSMDDHLREVFGTAVEELHDAATWTKVPPALTSALELRQFLAMAEDQIVRVRDRVRADMDPGLDMGELSADQLRFNAQWLEAALDAREGYRAALGELLRTMPLPDHRARPARTTQLRATAAPRPSVAPAPPRAGAFRAHRT
ncbi:hypothetical protein ACFYNN_34605 [Streptomyces sp. NPDC006978]|uniref:hypothetical protein n=1 Tax=Streptomyces sp. NPDC006978 TaxID=3364769 RepID=UPI00367B3217